MSDTKDSFAALVTKLQKPAAVSIGDFAPWSIKLMLSGAKFPGFWSSEIIPPETSGKTEWTLVQRFRTKEEAEKWQQSDERKKVIAEIQSTSNGSAISLSDEVSLSSDSHGSVATFIVTNVKDGMEEAYFDWENKIQTAQAKFPGYRGAYMQPPPPGKQGQWATLLRFDTPVELEKWFASPERLELITEGQKFVKSTQFKQVTNSFPGWFPADATTGESPPSWKMACLVLLGLFPVIQLELRFLMPFLTSWHPVVSGVFGMLLSIAATTYGTNPAFIKVFGWWMYPELRTPKVDGLGILGVLAILAVEMAIFMLT